MVGLFTAYLFFDVFVIVLPLPVLLPALSLGLDFTFDLSSFFLLFVLFLVLLLENLLAFGKVPLSVLLSALSLYLVLVSSHSQSFYQLLASTLS